MEDIEIFDDSESYEVNCARERCYKAKENFLKAKENFLKAKENFLKEGLLKVNDKCQCWLAKENFVKAKEKIMQEELPKVKEKLTRGATILKEELPKVKDKLTRGATIFKEIFTNRQQQTKDLQEKLEQERRCNAILQKNIQEQGDMVKRLKQLEDKVEEMNRSRTGEILKGFRREQKIMEQDHAIEEKRIACDRLQQKIKELEDEINRNSALSKYEMSTDPRGFCLIINNLKFHEKDLDRKGGEVDESELVKLFEERFFNVCVYRDLECEEMRNLAADFAKKDHSQFDAFVFIIMSHGGDQDVISGVKGRNIRVEDLMAEFKAKNCPTLQNKPKMFVIQTCRGRCKETVSPAPGVVVSDAPCVADSTLPRGSCPQETDFLLAFATAPGYPAWRNTLNGSLYIQNFVEAIREHHRSHHLADILAEVHKRVVEIGVTEGAVIQVPALTHTLRGQVYL